MSWIPPLCFLAGMVVGLPAVLALAAWYDRRKSNVVELPKREPSNVIPLGARKDNVRVLIPRKWGA